MSHPVENRLKLFHQRYSVDEKSGCWLWTGSKDRYGYGKLSWKGFHTAHRFSYSHFNGEIPDGKFICHSCDVRHCVNPDHLWIGDALTNMIDRDNKGRQASGARIRKTLTVEQALSARKELINGAMLKDIQSKYMVSEGTASNLKNSKTWHFR